MWDINTDDLIQVEVGNNVIKQYTENDKRGVLGVIFGEKPPKEGQLFITYAQYLRDLLAKDSIYLPTIKFRDNPNINANEFIVYVGLDYISANTKTHDLYECIAYLVKRLQIKNPEKETLNTLLQEAEININKPHDAILMFSQVYYWSNLIPDCLSEMVNAILNVAAIMQYNGKYEESKILLERGNILTKRSWFYDYLLKYFVANSLANINIIKQNIPMAVQHYDEAFNIIKNTDKPEYTAFALYNCAYIRLITGQFYDAGEIFEMSLDVLQKNNIIISEQKDSLLSLSNLSYKLAAKKSMEQYAVLLQQYKAEIDKPNKVISSIFVDIGGFAAKLLQTVAINGVSQFILSKTGLIGDNITNNIGNIERLVQAKNYYGQR